MRAENFDFLSNLDTLWAVALGAVLATTGGFVATQLEHRVDVGRRQRQAALFFGEVMSLLGVTVAAAERARGIGDPYGPVTMRLLRMIQREIDVYDRNRERLFELRDPSLRVKIHTTLLRTIMGVQGALEAAEGRLKRIGRERAVRIVAWLNDLDLALKGTHSEASRARFALEELFLRLSKKSA